MALGISGGSIGLPRRFRLTDAADIETPPVVISVSERGLALSLDIALRAHGLETEIHDVGEGLATLPLSTHSTLIVDGHVLPKDPQSFLDRLRRQTWAGRLIVLVEDLPSPALVRLRNEGAVLIEKPFGSNELIAQIDLPRQP
jgi:DNA-binding response OmpR family regulator